MAGFEDDELTVRKLTVRGDDGRSAVVSPDGIVIEGPTGRIEACFSEDASSAPVLLLTSADGSRLALRAEHDATGIALTAPDGKWSALVSAGLKVVSDQRIALSADGLIVQSLDGETRLDIPFSLGVPGFVAGLLAKVKAAITRAA